MTTARVPQDRKPRVRKPTAAEMRASEAVVAEVDAEAGEGFIVVPLAGETSVTIGPAGDWPASATRAMHEGNWDVWAEKVLTPEDYTVWSEIDPTNTEVNEFFAAWGELAGVTPGESRSSRRGSRSTPRR